jgi:hypothetical protein
MAWIYRIGQGDLWRPDGSLAGEAAAGPVRPIGPGRYRIGLAFTGEITGPLTMRLFPLGRRGPSPGCIQGEELVLLPGCIIVNHQVRAEIDASADRELKAIA